MVQEAIVSKVFADKMAEVSVVRTSACGKNCSSCEGCALQTKLSVVAFNKTSSSVGQKVLIESQSSKIFGAAVAVYLLPMFTMIFASVFAAYCGASETVCVISAFGGLALGLCIVFAINRFLKGKKAIEYTIIKELS